MDILLMRHGRAAERDTFHGPDEQRPLTTAGRTRLKRALPGLRQLVPRIDQVISSPLLRARQTAELVLEQFPAVSSEVAELAPGGDPQKLTRWLARQRSEIVLLVGHEPDLGQLASWYLTGSRESFMPMKKGAICLLRFSGTPRAAQGELRLWISAGQLRRLGA